MMGKQSLLISATKNVMLLRGANFSCSAATQNKNYQVVIVGGGTGGCSTAAKFASKLGKDKVAVIEPSVTHYYQPLWTLVGGGMKKFEESARPMADVLPKKADWIKSKVVSFKPDENKVVTEHGQEIGYEYLVVAMGLQLNYDKIKGLPQAFETPGVCSNYSPLYVNKTTTALQDFKGGPAIFTFPNTPIKCAGAPQKIMYIFEENIQKKIVTRKDYNIQFYSGLGVLFSSKYYADRLWQVAERRNIGINLKKNLIEIDTDKRELQFQNVEKVEDITTIPYDFVHITPPMSTVDSLRNSSLVDATGYLNVNKETLQHVQYKNIFGIGDCTNLPTSKTMAAVAGQVGVLRKNLNNAMAKLPLGAIYDGYTSCPLVTGYSTCIMAEFDYSTNPLETFPFDQRKESRAMFHLKKDLMPSLYWNGMVKGYWEGPAMLRKLFHMGMK